jgi:hypothetical protein
MKTGQTCSVTLKVKNVGSRRWNYPTLNDPINPYELRSVSGADTNVWGYTVINVGYVDAGSEITITFNVTAPTTPGIYNFQWNMTRGAAPFPSASPLIKVRVTNDDFELPGPPTVEAITSTSVRLKLPPLPYHTDSLTLQRAVWAAPPAIPTNGQILWLKADAITTLPDGSPVASWPASAGAGAATQSNAAKRPLWIQGGANGRPAVRFDGLDDYLQFPDQDSILSAFVVVKHRTGKGTDKIRPPLLGHTDTNKVDFRGNIDSVLFHSAESGENIIKGAGFVNGVSVAPASMQKPSTFQVITLLPNSGAHANNLGLDPAGPDPGPHPVRLWDGDYAEVLLYNRTLSPQERQTVENYLASKYGTGNNYPLPTGLSWVNVATNQPGDISYTNTSLTTNTTYWYRCVTSYGSGPAISVTTAPAAAPAPGAPAAPTFSNITADSVTVTAPVLPANTDYLKLQKKLGADPAGAYEDIAVSLAGGAQTVASGLTEQTAYTFRYVAVGSGGATNGTQVSVTTGAAGPDAPDAPLFSDVTQTTLTVTTPDLPARATSLKVQRKLGSEADTSYVDIFTGLAGQTARSVTGLTANTAYIFRSVAVGTAGSTPGIGAGVSTPAYPPDAPGRPTFSNVWTDSLRITAPAMPTNADRMRLQGKLAADPVTAYVDIVTVYAGAAITDMTGLSSGVTYSFRYVALGSGGSATGVEGTVTTLVPVTTWAVGSVIECAGIRWPLPNASIKAGTEVKISGYLASDWDMRQVTIGGITVSTPHTDTCTYSWGKTGGTFKNNINNQQSVTWIAPTTPGTYTLDLSVDDQNSLNKANGEGGSRNDNVRNYNDPSLKFTVVVTVVP